MKREAVTVAIVALLAWPLTRPLGWDDFPLSSYPMFSREIGATSTLPHALVVHADGHRTPAPPALVGSPEPMVASAIVMRAIRGGSANELCASIASRAKEGIAVEVVESTYDTKRYFQENDRTPSARTVFARCDVARGAP